MSGGSRRPRSPGAERRWPWVLGILLQAALLALYYLPARKGLVGDEKLYLRAAESILATGAPALDPLWPPLYPWFLAPLLAVAGGSLWLVQATQIALWALAAGLGARLTARWTGSERAGTIALWILLTYPPLAAFAHYLWPEILHLALLLGSVALLDRAATRPRAALGAGLLAALALQTKALMVALLPLLAVALAWRSPRGRRLLPVAGFVLAAALGLLPNLLAGEGSGVARSGWFNLWVGVNDVSRREFVDSIVAEEYRRYERSARSHAARSEILAAKVEQRIAEQGWAATLERQLGRQYFRLFDKDGFLTAQLPGGPLPAGEGYQRTPPVVARWLRGVSWGGWAVLLAGAAWGAAVFPYRRRPIGIAVLAFVGIQLGLFLLLHVKTRYRIQLLPAFAFFAAHGADALRGLQAGSAGPHRVRVVAAALIAAALLALAFGG